MSEYWNVIEPVWDIIDIYEGPDVFLATVETVRPEIVVLYATHFCQSEVCNGGFTQFFWNNTGVLGPEAVRGFDAIGQRQIANIVQKAMDMLCQPYSRDRQTRQAALKELLPDTEGKPHRGGVPGYRNVDAFKPLEDEFYALLDTDNGGFESAANKYAEKVAAL